MRKCLFIAMAALAMFSCSKAEMTVENEPQPFQYLFSIAEKPSFDADTKSVKTSWEDGDKIYIVFDDSLPESLEDFMILEYSASAEDWEVVQESKTAPKEEGGTLDALYYADPNPERGYKNDTYEEFLFEADGKEYGKYMFLNGNDIAYSVEDGKVISSITLDFEENHVRAYVQFCITGIEGDWLIYANDWKENSNSFAFWIPVWDLGNKSFTYDSSIEKRVRMNKLEDGQYTYFSFQQHAETITITLEKISGDNAGIYQKTFNKQISGKCAAITFKGPQFDDSGVPTNGWNSISSGSIGGHSYVDLGGGVFWATTNLGAETYDDEGDFYAWGEVEPYYSSKYPIVWKDDKPEGYAYDSNRYWEWTNDEHELGRFIKYTKEEGNETLESSDDAASVNWGDPWRTPTRAEWEWLIDNCTWEYDRQDLTFRVKSNITGYESNFITLPTIGYYLRKELYFDCVYMTSSSSPMINSAYYCYAIFLDEMGHKFYSTPRVYGIPVRPVITKE